MNDGRGGPAGGRRASLYFLLSAVAAGLLIALALFAVFYLLVLDDRDDGAGETGNLAAADLTAELDATAVAEAAGDGPAGGGDPAPTATLGGSRALFLFYDPNRFYAWNPTAEDIAIGSLALEAVDGNGQPLPFRFNGGRWAAFFPDLQPGKCNRIEVLFSDATLEPAQCRGYNAILTPQAGENDIFWTGREGAAEFRVLWNDQEVGRCPMESGECEVALP
jgi:hypothetical protein